MNTALMKDLIKQSVHPRDHGEGYPGISTTSKIGVFHITHSGVFDKVHQHFLEITGMSFNQIYNKVWLQAVHCEDRDRVCKDWYLSIMRNDSFSATFRIPDHAHGGCKQVSCSMIPETPEQNIKTGYFGIFIETVHYRQAV